MDYLSKMMDWEQGNLEWQETIELFQYLLNTGIIDHLQGCYGRYMLAMIDAGHVAVSQKKVSPKV